MQDKGKRLFRYCTYLRDLEKGCLMNSIMEKILKAAMPFISLYLSKIILDGAFNKEPMNHILKYVWIMAGANLIVMIAQGYFQSRSREVEFNLQKKHELFKGSKLMNLEYEMLEGSSLRDVVEELQQLERTGINNFRSFSREIGNLFGGTIGAGIAMYFSMEFFLRDMNEGGIEGIALNSIFIVLFLFFNILSFKVISKSNKKAGKFNKEITSAFKYVKEYINIIYDYRAAKDIRLYNMKLARKGGEVYRKNAGEIYSGFWHRYGKGIRVSGTLNSVLTAIIFIFVGIRGLQGTITAGEIMLYTGAINKIFGNVTVIIKSLSIIIPSDLYREKLFKFYDLEETQKGGEKIEDTTKGMELEFKNVSFKYPNTERYILKNISFKIKQGEKVALVGVNGSGKTTLIKLLLGLYKVGEGEITLNGKNISDFQWKEYSKVFSVVFQDYKLLSLNIGENISASSRYDSFKVEKTLEKVGMKEFLNKNGMDSYLYRDFHEKGIEVSGGEAQKIAMARAVYKVGKIFVLDEPTSALDPIAEQDIYTKFNSIIGDNTAVYISHRLSSCQFCNNICVIDKGNIVQFGTHKELMKEEQGKYRQLWDSQAEHYKDKIKIS